MKLNSWGNYPYHPQIPHPIYWRNDLTHDFAFLAKKYGSILPFGNGRSYGDSCFAASGHVLHMKPLNRFIVANWQSGIIRAESGVTFEEILELIIPKGWFLPVTPGTKYVTLGGAVANDVHGKNHHRRGTFGCYIKKFSLSRSDGSQITCSPTENTELFNATIGGLGLTGIITWVEFQLIPISSSFIETTTIRFGSLDEFFALSNELDELYEYSVAWVDCLAKGNNIGRGILTLGNHAKNKDLKINYKPKITVPFTPPFSLINKVTLKLLNSLYYQSHSPNKKHKLADYDSFFYPLDRILEWNKVYGKKGFQQYQCVIPEQNAQAIMKDLLSTIADMKAGSFLAVLKRCGDIPSPGLLSFPIKGLSLALDFAEQSKVNQKLFTHLDDIVRNAKGRLYPAKDAHMTSDDFKNFYPNWSLVETLRDPALCSDFWKRVTN